MTESTDHSARAGLLDPELHPELMIHNVAEIRPTLRRLHERRILVNVHLERGGQSFVSALLDVTDDALILDASPDEWLNKRAASSARLTCSAQLDGVRIQFDLDGATLVTHEGLNALELPLPESMLRLQRRESFRLSVPQHSPIQCVVNVPAPRTETAPGSPVQPSVETRPRVVDISTEGIALLFPTGDVALAMGTVLPDASITLPEGDNARLTLRVQNLQHTTLPNGAQSTRIGCSMVGVTPRFAAQIQRYIFKIERERKLLEND